jgi:hypothetical protein
MIYTSSRLNGKKIWLPFLILLLGFVSVNPWSKMPIGNTFTNWFICFLILCAFLGEKKANRVQFKTSGYKIVTAFLLWALIGIARGVFIADNYWEYKALVNDSFILLFPLIVFAFENPLTVKKVYRMWIVFGLLTYALFFYWNVNLTQFYLGPIYFVGCFLPLIPKKAWKVLVLILLILLLTYHYQDNRSQSIKALVSIGVALGCLFKRWIPNKALNVVWVLLYISPIVLLVLGITGKFNVFSNTNDKYGGRNVIQEQNSTADISSDTRTFIYMEVITSAIEHHYVWFGRTPARGNDTQAFYDLANDLQSVSHAGNIKHERYSNEVCFPNIFTWLGLVGMILYIGIYFRASYLGLFKSRNFYVKMAGIVTAFNFAYGWVENITNFDILNVVYWTFISICLSSQFRNMSDGEFKNWFNGLFYKGQAYFYINKH